LRPRIHRHSDDAATLVLSDAQLLAYLISEL
jgi:hypothetical protein